MIKIIKIILSLLFLLCLLKWPYGYYMFVRFVALIGFALLAYNSHEQGYKNEMLIYIGLALLFQPFFKVILGRTLWNIVDVVVAICLLSSLFINKTRK